MLDDRTANYFAVDFKFRSGSNRSLRMVLSDINLKNKMEKEREEKSERKGENEYVYTRIV